MSFWLTRLFYIRGLGSLYVIMGAILFFQGPSLIGESGLHPLVEHLKLSSQQSASEFFLNYPSLFWLNASDLMIKSMACTFLIFGALMFLGFCNIIVLFILWSIQLSLVNAGSPFFAFGWETMMLEMTFLSVFFIHPWRMNLLSVKNRFPHYLCFLPLLWLMFRLMFGAGLIKLRGDACWLDLTCMDYHYQTQPNPHVLSWFYHQLPNWFHRIEVLLTHFCEIVVPFLFLSTTKWRRVGGLIIIFFQITLMSTGNLAFINWQTIVLSFVAFDDQFLRKFVSYKTRTKIKELSLLSPHSLDQQSALKSKSQEKLDIIKIKDLKSENEKTISFVNIKGLHLNLIHNLNFFKLLNNLDLKLVVFGLLIVGFLSIKPLMNLISHEQRMNESYNRFHLINSYGLFGSITKVRYEVVISATSDQTLTEQTIWKEYIFYCKPSGVDQRPCLITPYHLRLDWQMWFSAMRPSLQEPWLARLAEKILKNDPQLNSLLITNPFAAESPPHWIKMDLYEYDFASAESTDWWRRKWYKIYLNPSQLRYEK